MLHVDFWFEDAKGQLIVIGWSDLPGVALQLNDQNRFDPMPRVVDRYARADLGSVAPLAFVAIFAPLAQQGEATGISVEASGQSRVLTDQGNGFRGVAESGVREAYDRVFLLLSTGQIEIEVDAACAAIVSRRMANYPAGAVEMIQFALSVDTGIVTGDGAALLNGWFLANRKYPGCKVSGFRISSDSITPLRLFAGQVERADLAGFAERYHFTGRDGFIATTLPPKVARKSRLTQIYLVVDMGTTTTIVTVPMQIAAPQVAGRTLAMFHHTLKRIDQRHALMEGFLGHGRTSDRQDLALAFSTQDLGRSALIVDLDVDGEFAGDLCLSFYAKRVAIDRIVLLVDPSDNAAFRAIDRVVAEFAEAHGAPEIVLTERGGLESILAQLAQDGFVRLAFGRASVLFHVLDTDPDRLMQTLASSASEVLVFSATAHMSGFAAAEISGGYQPLILAAPLTAVQLALDDTPAVFMTEEAMFKYILATNAACFDRHMVDPGYLLGQAGLNNAILAWGQNAYAVDSRALSLMLKAGARP